MNLVTERCAKEVKPIPSIYSEKLNKLRNNEWDDTSREVVERPSTFNSAKSSLYRSRRKQTPPLPRSMTDIALEGKWTQTATGTAFYSSMTINQLRPRQRRHHSVNSTLYWLCYWPMGRRRQIVMESLWNTLPKSLKDGTANLWRWHNTPTPISTLQYKSSKTSRAVLELQRSREQLVVPLDHGPRNTWTLIADSQHSRTDTRLVWSTWLLMQTQLSSYST